MFDLRSDLILCKLQKAFHSHDAEICSGIISLYRIYNTDKLVEEGALIRHEGVYDDASLDDLTYTHANGEKHSRRTSSDTSARADQTRGRRP